MDTIAVVTGASHGIGESISIKLLDKGFKVYGISRTQPKIQSQKFIWIQADLLKKSDYNSITNAISEYNIDLLVNNAGIGFLQQTIDYTDEDFDRMFNLNFKAQINITNIFLPKLQNGLVLTISSLGDRYPDSGWGLYASSKAALNIFFETMAVENTQVKFINILPSYIDTPMQHELHDRTDFDWNICMNVDDVAEVIVDTIQGQERIETGSRLIIEQSVQKEELYLPEKVWTYSIEGKEIRKLR